MTDKDISIQVIRRLPKYYRILTELENDGVTKISSTRLARKLGSSASQIRQDLNCFGGFGQQGYGYQVSLLRGEIGRILGLQNTHNAILIGAGNLGRAIATHMDFEKMGFKLRGIFDRDPKLLGTEIHGVTVTRKEAFSEISREYVIDTAILTMPEKLSYNVAKELISLGIKYFWNFTHYDIAADFPEVIVENVRLSDSLMTLCYRINEQNAE